MCHRVLGDLCSNPHPWPFPRTRGKGSPRPLRRGAAHRAYHHRPRNAHRSAHRQGPVSGNVRPPRSARPRMSGASLRRPARGVGAYQRAAAIAATRRTPASRWRGRIWRRRRPPSLTLPPQARRKGTRVGAGGGPARSRPQHGDGVLLGRGGCGGGDGEAGGWKLEVGCGRIS